MILVLLAVNLQLVQLLLATEAIAPTQMILKLQIQNMAKLCVQ